MMNTKLLKEKILYLAMRGKLVSQDSNDEPATELLKRIEKEKQKLIKEKKIKKQKNLPPITTEEIPFEIPLSWKWVKLLNLGILKTGKTPSTKQKEYYYGEIPFIQPNDIFFDKINYETKSKLSEAGYKIVRTAVENSVLMVCIGGSIGKCFYIDRECAFNQQINSVTPFIEKKCLSKFILFFFKSVFFQNQILKNSSGTTIPIINKFRWGNLRISLPPLNEQKRIVEKIESLFLLIDQIEEKKELLKKTIDLTQEKILDLAMRGKLVSSNAEKWEEYKIKDLFDVERGGSPRPIKQYLTQDQDGINWIKIGDTVKGEKYIFQTEQKILKSGLKKTRMVYEGDFLLSNSMSFGRPYIMKISGAVHDGWLILREKKNNLFKDFYFYLFSSKPFFNQLDKVASGTTVKNLNKKIVQNVYVPLPPLNEQKRIVDKIESLFNNIEKIKQKLEL